MYIQYINIYVYIGINIHIDVYNMSMNNNKYYFIIRYKMLIHGSVMQAT